MQDIQFKDTDSGSIQVFLDNTLIAEYDKGWSALGEVLVQHYSGNSKTHELPHELLMSHGLFSLNHFWPDQCKDKDGFDISFDHEDGFKSIAWVLDQGASARIMVALGEAQARIPEKTYSYSAGDDEDWVITCLYDNGIEVWVGNVDTESQAELFVETLQSKAQGTKRQFAVYLDGGLIKGIQEHNAASHVPAAEFVVVDTSVYEGFDPEADDSAIQVQDGNGRAVWAAVDRKDPDGVPFNTQLAIDAVK